MDALTFLRQFSFLMNNPSASSLPGATGAPQGIQDITIEPRRGFDFRHFWHSIVERLWIVALCTVAGLFLSLGYLARTPKLYQSHGVLEVDFQEPTMIAGEETASRMRSMFLASQEALRTIEQNLTNLTLMARVVRSEGLADDGGRALLGRNADAPNEHKTTPAPSKAASAAAADTFGASAFTPMEEGLGRALSSMVKPVIRRGTRLIDLYVTNRDPAMAQRLADAVGREYIRMSIERHATFSQESLRYMMEEEERLKGNLRKSEAAVAEYKANTPDALQLGGGAAATGTQQGAGAGGGRGGLVEDQLQDLTSKVTSAKTDRVRLESELSQIEQIGNNTDALLNVPSIANATTVVDRRRDVAQMETTVASLQQRYKAKHPKMMAAQAGLTEAKNALSRAVLAQPDVLRNVLSQARAAETSLGSATQDQEKAAIALNKAAIGYQELARQAETDRALYESVLRQIKETNLTKDAKTNAVSVAEHAILPYTPASPQPFKAIALGVLGGLAAGLGFIYGADVLDRSIKTVDQAESLLGLPVLAAVPEKTDPARAKAKTNKTFNARTTYRLVAEAPEGPVAESFRNLRASLSLLGPEIERRVFLFTSALPSEGKSFTSANYALALAQQGYRVLLVDGDLRRPSLHRIFLGSDAQGRTLKAETASPGIVDCLVGEADLSTAVRRVLARDVDVTGATRDDTGEFTTATGGQFSILAGGRRAPNPAELLSGPSFGELIASAARLFDRVVIDSAPVIAVSDTLLMMPFVQTVSLVVRAAKTPRNAAHRALSLLVTAGARPAGVILNRLPRRRGVGHYYYYASHGYGAGEGSYGSGEGSYRQRNETKPSILSR